VAIDQAAFAKTKSCNGVFAVIDTASETGTDHDATAVTFFALDKLSRRATLLILD
jgi:hypothetical protein